MEIGIVGLPNVGKSTLFNALTKAHAASSNYPFTTIEPNVGVVSIPDKRLDALYDIFKPPKKIPSCIKFVDIAGLVKGASKGEGLGNKFLANIREVDALAQVVRCFADPDVVHVLGGIDPVRDVEVIETELMLSDLEAVDKMIEKNTGAARTGSKEAKEKMEKLQKLHDLLGAGQPASAAGYTKEEIRDFNLLTNKPVLYVANTAETPDMAVVNKFKAFAESRGACFVQISAKIEAELIELNDEERAAFLKDLGETFTGLEKIIRASTELLKLISFFTTGSEDEVRSWTIPAGTKAPRAAGKIHSDMERGFIRAEVYAFSDIAAHREEKVLKEKGLIRSEGKEYVMRDGDVCFFKFNV